MIKTILLGLPLMLGAVSAPSVQATEASIEVAQSVQPKYASVNGDTISFTAEEVNFKFENLATTIINFINDSTIGDYGFLYIAYNNVNYHLSTQVVAPFSNDVITFTSGNNLIEPLAIMIDNERYGLPETMSNGIPNYCLFDLSDDRLLTSAFSIVVDETDTTTLYQNIMGALEQDIIDNTETMPTIAQMFEVVSDALQSFATTLGSAFTSVTALFWDSTASAPTFLGMLSLAVLGAGLIYLAFNLIRGLIRRIRG